jgi:YfiH family protein
VTARVRFTDASDGDLRVTQPASTLQERRSRLLPLPWTWLHQVHGAEVVVVDSPGQHAGLAADAAVTGQLDAVLAIHTADCVPVALISAEGVVGAVHAGWRGLAAGTVEAGVTALRELGATVVTAVIGPCIRPECYEFGQTELDRLAERYGPEVRARTSEGTHSLDLPATVRAALARADVSEVEDVALCTACDQRFFSHRARGDVGRQAMLVWLEPSG